ncbi:MAG: PTPA-CTERM sorting domain-containing protein [Alkalinema sp. RL_2_19]|nr:PTPA-CTERM sorting domain-containing protein [Alkalinema sp. RL_2_19]
MKYLLQAAIGGSVAVAIAAIPAQAATVKTTTTPPGGGTIANSAYAIDNLEVTVDGVTSTYNVDFEFGPFTGTPNGVYNPPVAFGLNDALGRGNAILTAISEYAPAVSQFVDNTPIFGTNTPSQVYIPIALASVTVGNNVDNQVAICSIGGICDVNQFQNPNGNVMYAKFTEVTGGNTAIPTPAMIPGLIGMGAATLRRKKRVVQAG